MTPDSALLPWITGAGGAVVVLAIVAWAFATGKIHSDSEFRAVVAERDEYKATGVVDQQAIKELAGTGNVTNQFLTAFAAIAQAKQDEAVRHARDTTPEDLGMR